MSFVPVKGLDGWLITIQWCRWLSCSTYVFENLFDTIQCLYVIGLTEGPPPPRPPTQVQNYGPQFEGANHRTMQPSFQYSQCTGKKKALCVCHCPSLQIYASKIHACVQIGINYFGQAGELRGCINDVHNIQGFIIRKLLKALS